MDDELEGTQDARIEKLWNSSDTRGDGQLDVKGLKSGLRKWVQQSQAALTSHTDHGPPSGSITL